MPCPIWRGTPRWFLSEKNKDFIIKFFDLKVFFRFKNKNNKKLHVTPLQITLKAWTLNYSQSNSANYEC